MYEVPTQSSRPLVLSIDPDPIARSLVTIVVQELGGTTIEAADALTGLDLLNQYARSLSMIVLDIRLPDMDGYDLCVRLKEIAGQRGLHFKVLPYTATGVMEMLLDELGCARPCFKPATSEQLAMAIQRTLDAPMRPLPATPLVELLHLHAMRAEQTARQERALRTALLATSMPARLGLHQLLAGVGARIVAESGTADTLQHLLGRHQAHILVADANDRHRAVELATAHGLALLVVATARDHIPELAGDTPLLARTQGVVDLTDEQAPATLAMALAELARGQRVVHLPHDRAIPQHGNVVPALVDQLLRNAGLTARERQVLWLDVHRWNTEQIAARLGVAPRSIDSYWKRIQRKLQKDRDGVRAWVKEQIARHDAKEAASDLEHSVGSNK